MRQIRLLDPDMFAGCDVIKASLLSDCERADEIVRETEAWASDQREALIQATEAARSTAYAEAYADGLRQFSDAVSSCSAAVEDLNLRLLDLLKTCVRQVLTTIPPDDFLQSAIAPVLRVVPSGSAITISVHPDRVADLDVALARVAHDGSGGFAMDVVSDATLDPGACLIFTRSDVFDVSIEVLTDRLIDAVASHLHETTDEDA